MWLVQTPYIFSRISKFYKTSTLLYSIHLHYSAYKLHLHTCYWQIICGVEGYYPTVFFDTISEKINYISANKKNNNDNDNYHKLFANVFTT